MDTLLGDLRDHDDLLTWQGNRIDLRSVRPRQARHHLSDPTISVFVLGCGAEIISSVSCNKVLEIFEGFVAGKKCFIKCCIVLLLMVG